MSAEQDLEVCTSPVIHEDIVQEVSRRMQAREDYGRLAELMKNFADSTRVQILHALEQHELCVCDIAALLGLTKSAVSHQLKNLRLANLVKSRREAQVIFYSLADDHVKTLIDIGFEHIYEE